MADERPNPDQLELFARAKSMSRWAADHVSISDSATASGGTSRSTADHVSVTDAVIAGVGRVGAMALGGSVTLRIEGAGTTEVALPITPGPRTVGPTVGRDFAMPVTPGPRTYELGGTAVGKATASGEITVTPRDRPTERSMGEVLAIIFAGPSTWLLTYDLLGAVGADGTPVRFPVPVSAGLIVMILLYYPDGRRWLRALAAVLSTQE